MNLSKEKKKVVAHGLSHFFFNLEFSEMSDLNGGEKDFSMALSVELRSIE